MRSSRWSVDAEGRGKAATKTGQRMQAASKRSEQVKEAREIHQRLAAHAVDFVDERAKGKWGVGHP